jgi:hypothetical protein
MAWQQKKETSSGTFSEHEAQEMFGCSKRYIERERARTEELWGGMKKN